MMMVIGFCGEMDKINNFRTQQNKLLVNCNHLTHSLHAIFSIDFTKYVDVVKLEDIVCLFRFNPEADVKWVRSL